MKELLRAVSHMALYNQRLTLPEMRELVLRHLLSTHDSVGDQQLTRLLFTTYMQMLFSASIFDDAKLYHQNRFMSVDKQGNADRGGITDFFRENYLLGIKHGLSEVGKPDTISDFDPTYVPHNLPLTAGEYPKDIVEQFAAVMGYMAATGKRAA